MGLKRVVSTDFWTDSKVDEFSPEDKYFMLWLLTNPRVTLLGIYEISIRQAAFQLGYSVEAVKVLLDRFENKYGMILFSEETNEVAIKNFLRHSVIGGGKPVEDCLSREIRAVKNKRLVGEVFGYLDGKEGTNETVKKIVSEYKDLTVMDMDMDMVDSYHESSTNRPRIANESSKDKAPRHKHGEYKNVLLSDDDLSKLQKEFPADWADRIERLSSYMASTGKSYKNHLATIRNWAKRDEPKKQEVASRYAQYDN